MKTVVLIHGALGAAQQLDELHKMLQVKYNVLVYEIPGHGQRSAETKDFSIQHFATDFHQWLKAHTNQPVTVFGFSMGGYITLYLSVTQPQLFHHIITLGTKFKWSVEEAAKESAKLNPLKLQEKVPDYVTYLNQLHGSAWENVVNRTASLMKLLGSRPLITPGIADIIQVNTTFLWGELDKMVTEEETILVQEAVQESVFISLPGFVHSLEKLDSVELGSILTKIIG